MKYLFLTLIALSTPCLVICQSGSTTDLTEQPLFKDQSRQTMFNTARDPNAALTSGGAFYISNPTPLYEVDAEKAYLSSNFEVLTVILQNGDEYELPGRVRLIDQKIEVKIEGGVYDLDNQVVQAVIDAKDRIFVAGFDPVGRIKGTQLYEVVYANADRRLLINHSTVWEDPPQQNMFDTREAHKTLKRTERVYLIDGPRSTEIDRLADVLNALYLDRGSRGAQYAKRERLRNEVADYVALLRFLETRE
ncbi:hypothetical protein [Neolewinella sp.]|uniref:hypothetical protein n=1 Tax=Neolewinella sp. TaxID=2993543 RepID=UPI003B51E818